MKVDTLVKITCCAILSEIVYHFFKRVYGKLKKKGVNPNSLTGALIQLYEPKDQRNKIHIFNKVLFFPDPGILCKREQAGRVCRDKTCCYTHGQTSLSVLLSVLKSSKRTIDVCVYMITCSILGDTLVECHKNGVSLRVITEERNSGEEGEVSGAQIGKLRASGILVYCRESSFWMHHKFLVADNEVLVTGSFNWTNQAVMGNLENLIITSKNDLVQPFISEFESLWGSFKKIAQASSNTLNSVHS